MSGTCTGAIHSFPSCSEPVTRASQRNEQGIHPTRPSESVWLRERVSPSIASDDGCSCRQVPTANGNNRAGGLAMIRLAWCARRRRKENVQNPTTRNGGATADFGGSTVALNTRTVVLNTR